MICTHSWYVFQGAFLDNIRTQRPKKMRCGTLRLKQLESIALRPFELFGSVPRCPHTHEVSLEDKGVNLPRRFEQ